MDSDGEYAYTSDDDVEGEEPWTVARKMKKKKKAARPRAPTGTLRRVRRRAAPLPAGGAGRRLKEFLLWRERCMGERREARERARWSNVRAPPGLLVRPVVLEVDLANNEIVVYL